MSVRGRPSLENIGLQILCHYMEVCIDDVGLYLALCFSLVRKFDKFLLLKQKYHSGQNIKGVPDLS